MFKYLYYRYIITLIFLFFLSLIISGYSNYELEIILTRSGIGSLNINSILFEKLNKKEYFPPLNITTIPTLTNLFENQTLIIKEISLFTQLDELITQNLTLEIKELNKTHLKINNSTYRIIIYLKINNYPLLNFNLLKYNGIETYILKDSSIIKNDEYIYEPKNNKLSKYNIKITCYLPGYIKNTYPLILKNHKISPIININGSIITWLVPLNLLINKNIQKNILFAVDFTGEFKIQSYLQDKIKTNNNSY